MKVEFTNKQEINHIRQQAYLNLTGEERMRIFLQLMEKSTNLFAFKNRTSKNRDKNNFVIDLNSSK